MFVVRFTSNCARSVHQFVRGVQQMAVTKNPSGLVTLEYQQLKNHPETYSDAISAAYGPDGLGVLVVKDVPNFPESRQTMLPLARKFAELPDDIKRQVEDPDSFYSFGWSHGREVFQGQVDSAKGSYYNNPVADYFDEFDKDPECQKKYPEYCGRNLWPNTLPELRTSFLTLGNIIWKTGILVAAACDSYVSSLNSSYDKNLLARTIEQGVNHKARLLHYFPQKPEDADKADDSWCGWHLDHGSLTGLTSAMYVNEQLESVPNPDPKSGLYIKARNGDVVKAGIGADELAFQLGESSQLMSGGYLMATPHMVKAANTGTQISRDTYACFMQPTWKEPLSMPKNISAEQVKLAAVPKWVAGMTFAEFSRARFEEYY